MREWSIHPLFIGVNYIPNSIVMKLVEKMDVDANCGGFLSAVNSELIIFRGYFNLLGAPKA